VMSAIHVPMPRANARYAARRFQSVSTRTRLRQIPQIADNRTQAQQAPFACRFGCAASELQRREPARQAPGRASSPLPSPRQPTLAERERRFPASRELRARGPLSGREHSPGIGTLCPLRPRLPTVVALRRWSETPVAGAAQVRERLRPPKHPALGTADPGGR
jgi:hypothetical protein